MRRTKEEATATRELLLDSAELAFLRQGVAATTLQHIADAAGLTRGAVYHHFTDKLALIEAMLARIDLPLERAMQATEARHEADPLGQLRQLALGPLQLLQDDAHARRVFTILKHRMELAGDTAALLQRHQAALGDCQARIERLFDDARRRGLLAAGLNAKHAAVALTALIDGLLSLATLGDDPSAACAAAAPAIDALLAGQRALAQAGDAPATGLRAAA
jgi:TetR/AcrR family acrAB operon transcriptional repressor